MRKSVIIILTIIATAITAKAQHTPGQTTIYPRFGINMSKFAGDEIVIADQSPYETTVLSSKFKFGITAGAEIRHQISTYFAASAGLLYSMQGTRFDDYQQSDGNSHIQFSAPEITLHYLNLPVLGIINIGNSDFNVKCGVQLSWLLTAKSSNIYKISDSDDTQTKGEYAIGKVTDIFKRFDLSIPVGIGYERNRFAIDLRYNIHFMDVYKYISGVNNSNISLTFGYGLTL